MLAIVRYFVIIVGSTVPVSLGAWGQTTQSVFIGQWRGSWDGVSASTLDVTNVTETGAAYGVYTFRGRPFKFFAEIANHTLSWGDPVDGIGFEFTLQQNGRLRGERFDHGSHAGDIIMSKAKKSDQWSQWEI